jgi:hypothetical protein
VLPYLPPSAVDQLARDLHAAARIDYWIQDYFHGQTIGAAMRLWRKQLAAAPARFEAADWFAYFAERGFHVCEKIRLVDESERRRRLPPFSWSVLLAWLFTPSGTRYGSRDRLGYAMFERSSA